MRIDHVIYATADLDAASARVERDLGLAAAEGGRHEGMGTENRVVPLGGGYLELIAVADPAEAAGSVLGRALQDRLAESGDGLLAWAACVDDVEPYAKRLDTRVVEIAREGLSARLTGLEEALRDPYLPFFVARDPGVPDPGASGGAGGIAWVEIAGDGPRLDTWTGGARLPVRLVAGPSGLRSVGIGHEEVAWP